MNRLLTSAAFLALLIGCKKQDAPTTQPNGDKEAIVTHAPVTQIEGSDWSQYHISDAAQRREVIKSTLPANAGQVAQRCLTTAFRVDRQSNAVTGSAKGANYECGVVRSSSGVLEISFHGNRHTSAPTELYFDYDQKTNTYRLYTQKEKPASLLTAEDRAAQEKLEGRWMAGPHRGIDNRLTLYSAAEIQNPNTPELKALAPIGKALLAAAGNPVVQQRFGS